MRERQRHRETERDRERRQKEADRETENDAAEVAKDLKSLFKVKNFSLPTIH